MQWTRTPPANYPFVMGLPPVCVCVCVCVVHSRTLTVPLNFQITPECTGRLSAKAPICSQACTADWGTEIIVLAYNNAGDEYYDPNLLN